jgi:hypothetical protein
MNLKPYLRPQAYLTIIVKNVKKGRQDLPAGLGPGRRLDGTYTLKDEKHLVPEMRSAWPRTGWATPG